MTGQAKGLRFYATRMGGVERYTFPDLPQGRNVWELEPAGRDKGGPWSAANIMYAVTYPTRAAAVADMFATVRVRIEGVI